MFHAITSIAVVVIEPTSRSTVVVPADRGATGVPVLQVGIDHTFWSDLGPAPSHSASFT